MYGSGRTVLRRIIPHLNSGFNREMQDRRRSFVVAHESVTVSRFEGDMEKLDEIYCLKWNDRTASVEEIREYLSVKG